MKRESSDDYDVWACALIPLTDSILHELARLEDPGYKPYPHRMDAPKWWDTVDTELDEYFAAIEQRIGAA
jgi:hypothetical protein